jgi:Domain of unknown function (DUF4296)
MRYSICIAIVLLLLTTACSNKKAEAPIPAAKMQAIMLDIHLAEAYSGTIPDSAHSGKNRDSLARYYKEIFAHHQIAEADFNKGLEWYRVHPDELDSVYANMVIKLNAMNPSSVSK